MPVEVSGATGPRADIVNGTYMFTEERLNGKTVYSKRGDDSMCLYFACDKSWCITLTESAKAGKIAGYALSDQVLSHPTLGKQWRVDDGKAWQPQPVVASVMVSLFSRFSSL